jgi:peptide/nickel transport system substrate-binding protein
MKIDGVPKSKLDGPQIDRRTALKLLGGTGAAVALAGCSGNGGSGGTDDGSSGGSGGTDDGSSGGDGGRYGGSVSYSILQDSFGHLHPFMINQAEDLIVTGNVVSHLWKYDQNFNIYGDVAEDWEYTAPDTLEIQIRDNVTVHPPYGGNFDAEDMKYSMNLFGDVERGPESGQRDRFVDTIEVIDDYRIRLNMPQAFGAFVPLVTARQDLGWVVPPAVYEDKGFDGMEQKPAGTGPFYISERSPGDSITLVRHEDYHLTDDNGNQLPYVDEIEFSLIPEASTQLSALRSGDIEAANIMSWETFQSAQNSSDLEIITRPRGGWTGIAPLTQNPAKVAEENPEYLAAAGYYDDPGQYRDFSPPTTDVRVRRAMAKAIDRQDVVNRGFFGESVTNHNIWPRTVGDYLWAPDEAGSTIRDEPGQVYDPEGARQLLDEAGYTGSPRMELDMIVRTREQRLAVVAQDNLSDVGIKVNLQALQSAQFWQEVYSYTYPLVFYSQNGQPDPWSSVFRQYSTPMEGTNAGVWQKGLWFDEEFTEAAAEMNRYEPGSEERLALCKTMEDRFFDEEDGYPDIRATEAVVPRGHQSYIKGQSMPFDFTFFQGMWKDN